MMTRDEQNTVSTIVSGTTATLALREETVQKGLLALLLGIQGGHQVVRAGSARISSESAAWRLSRQ